MKEMNEMKDSVLKAADNMDALCEKGRQQVKDLVYVMHGWEKEHELWKANEYYYYIDRDGKVRPYYITNSPQIHGTICKYGNMFETKAEAELFSKRRSLMNKIEKHAYEMAGNKFLQNGYYICLNANIINITHTRIARGGTTYFKDSEQAKIIIKMYEKELLEYFNE